MTKKKLLLETKNLFLVVIFTFIYGLGVIWILEQAVPPLYTGGIPGLAQLVRSMLIEWANYDPGDIFLGLFVFVVNIPIIVLGWIGVSKRFTIYSLISVIIQSTVMGFIPRNNFGMTQGLDPFTLAVIGGIITGVGIGGALKFGSSTGGVDILAQYYSFKKGISVGFVSMVINIIIAIGGGIVYGSGAVTIYTIIRIIITTLVTDKVHTSYNFLKVEIITFYSEELLQELLVKIHRGITLLEVKGGYQMTEKSMLVVAISTYELTQLKEIVLKSDPHAFVMVQPIRHILGNFKRKPIV